MSKAAKVGDIIEIAFPYSSKRKNKQFTVIPRPEQTERDAIFGDAWIKDIGYVVFLPILSYKIVTRAVTEIVAKTKNVDMFLDEQRDANLASIFE